MAIPAGVDLDVHFQPVVGLRTGAVVGAEALLRGRIEGLPVPPRALIRQLREADLSVAELVLGVVGRAIDQWDQLAPGLEPWVSVNVDACDLEHSGVDRAVEAAVGAARAHRIVAEVTELQPVNAGRAAPVLDGLRDLGVRIAIDDFGVGESTLAQFEVLRPDLVKIDRSFVAGIQRRGGDRAVVQVTVALAQCLGIAVVAEGIETVDQLSRVRRAGCDLGQGFLFGAAVPAHEFARLLDQPYGTDGQRLDRAAC